MSREVEFLLFFLAICGVIDLVLLLIELLTRWLARREKLREVVGVKVRCCRCEQVWRASLYKLDGPRRQVTRCAKCDQEQVVTRG